MNDANHLLHYRPGAEGYGSWRLSCIDGTEGHGSWVERFWPSAEDCNCKASDCPCRVGDHSGCITDGRYIEELGYACRSDRDESTCWVHDWMNEYGAECIHGDDWPEDGPWPVACRWDGDGLEVHHATQVVTT